MKLEHSNGDKPRTELDDLREKIDELDRQILESLSKRMEVSKKIAKYKFENGLTILQQGRYDEILKNRRRQAEQNGLNPDFVIKVYNEIHEESVSLQNIIIKELSNNK